MSTKKLQVVGSILSTDTTLTQSGIAADAKIVGDLLAEKLDSSTLTDHVNDALAQAKASGEFDGAQGEDGISATHSWSGTTLTITSASGTTSADLKGEKGADGDDGVSCTHSWNGTTLTVTSASGSSSVDLKGDTGADGIGISSVKQTTTSTADDGNNIITITLSNGSTSTFTVQNGSKGSTGNKGDTGDSGYTPVRGTDYWTDADKAEIKSYVDEAILGGAW